MMEQEVRDYFDKIPEFPDVTFGICENTLKMNSYAMMSKMKVGDRWMRLRCTLGCSKEQNVTDLKAHDDLLNEMEQTHDHYVKHGFTEDVDHYDYNGWIMNPKLDGSSTYYNEELKRR